MAYTSKNPRLSSLILTDLVNAAGTNAPSSTIRLVDRNGIPYSRNSSGAEAIVGSGLTVAKSADYTVTDTDGVGTILVTTSSTTRTITLPTAADNTGRRLTVKKVDSGTGFVVLDGEGSETIDGITTTNVYTQYGTITIVCDGSNWLIVSLEESGIYTPTLNNTTNVASSSASVLDYYRVRQMVTVFGRTDIDPTSATTLTKLGISLPIPSDFNTTSIVGGTAVNSQGVPAQIIGDTTNDWASLEFITTADVASRDWFFQFSYRIRL